MSMLPSGYKEVKYIESSGGQYIDTGIIAGSNIEFDAMSSYSGTNDQALFGARSGSDYILWDNATSGNKAVNLKLKSTNYGNYACTSVKNVFSYHNNEFYVNGILKATTSVGTFSTGANIYICRINTSDSRYYKGRIYYLKLYDSGELVRDFVPCIRNADNSVGLYDLVTSAFFENTGTGNFTHGTIIPDPITPSWGSGKADTVHSQIIRRRPLYIGYKKNILDLSDTLSDVRMWGGAGCNMSRLDGVVTITRASRGETNFASICYINRTITSNYVSNYFEANIGYNYQANASCMEINKGLYLFSIDVTENNASGLLLKAGIGSASDNADLRTLGYLTNSYNLTTNPRFSIIFHVTETTLFNFALGWWGDFDKDIVIKCKPRLIKL